MTDHKNPPLIDITTAEPREIFLNRELTWLAFNERVLAEATRKKNPLLERVKFLAIVNNNLDEFFMKRIGGLKQELAAGINRISRDGLSIQEEINLCYEKIRQIEQDINKVWRHLQQELKKENIEIVKLQDLDKETQNKMDKYFQENIYPLITPQAVDPAHPFPFISNLSLNLIIQIRYPGTNKLGIARIKIPAGEGCKRFLDIGAEGKHIFITLEDLILHNLDLLFPNMDIETMGIFRVTRNAITEKDEEKTDDLLELIENALQERRLAPIVRMQYGLGINPTHKGMLAAECSLNEEKDTFEIDGLLAMRDLMELTSINRPDLKDQPYFPVEHEVLYGEDNIFHAIRNHKALLVQFPYESFSATVERLLRDAARDPKVLGIKMTIYRTSADAKIIDYLIEAGRNGKQVTVVVEVKARFDEHANIGWANRLEEAGIHVTYGIVGLKTHTKLIYIIRKDYDGLRRYAHIGTGNYHSGTARMYSDLGLITCDEKIGEDLTELFNYLTTGYTPNRNYHSLLPAPKQMKPALLAKIEREMKNAQAGKKAKIIFKANALEDIDISKALYLAGQAGVKIQLIIRDSCRVMAGVAGLSDNISVISIVGRFLEHSRIYYFYNNGEEEYYIGSADLMHRNLERRVEVITPITSAKVRHKLAHILKTQLEDVENGWVMQPDGHYKHRNNRKDKLSSQAQFMKDATQRLREASRLRLRKTKSAK